MVRILYW